MFKNPSFLFDIICTAAWIILVVRYARKGFLSSIVQLVGNLFSLLGAKELSTACAGWVFEHMLAGGFRTQIAANIAAGGAVDLSGIAEKYAGFLPASFRASIVAACERSIGAVLADNAVVLADSIVENVLQPLLTPVITLVLFFLFYALLRLLVSMLVTVLYNMVDTVFVGQTHDPYQMNAVSMATPVFMILMAFGNLFGIGGCAFISRSLGAREYERVKKISSFSFWGAVFVGLLATLALTLGVSWILPLVGADASANIANISKDISGDAYDKLVQNYQNLEQYTRDYLFYIGVGAIPTVLSSAMSNLVKGEGAAKVSMFGMMIGAVTNIILDPIMILAMGMGVKGAAIATSIGNTVATLFYLIYLKVSRTMLSPNPKHFTMKGGIFSGVFSIGVPMFFTNVLMSLSNLVLNRLLNNIDVLATGGMGIAMKANMLVVFIQLGIGIGIQPLVGFHYGARNFTKMTKVVRFSMVCTLVLGLILTALYFLFTEPVISIFMTSGSSGSAADVITQQNYAVKMLRALMVSGPFLGIIFVNNNAFQGMGHGLASLILSVSRQGFIFLPVLFIANALIGLDGLIFAQPIADICSVIMALIMMEVIKHKDKQMLKPGIRKA